MRSARARSPSLQSRSLCWTSRRVPSLWQTSGQFAPRCFPPQMSREFARGVPFLARAANRQRKTRVHRVHGQNSRARPMRVFTRMGGWVANPAPPSLTAAKISMLFPGIGRDETLWAINAMAICRFI
jgi:hypothetical protein